MNYVPAIGMEIHAELKTKTKMFCSSKNDPDETRPNVNICPVCMGHPGTLPVINKEAVRQVLRVGLAVGGAIADYSEFDRKNYFYPDIPKGYQLSQYRYPLVIGGMLSGVALTRIHLEEDTARSTHDGAGDESLIDFNRAGVPLMELVSEPVIQSAKEAADFARELQLVLRTLGASEANMEKGEMRVETNISLASPKANSAAFTRLLTGSDADQNLPWAPLTLGTKVEVKNLNSFRSVERAIEYEIQRQTHALEAGESIVQETRGWDETKGVTFSQRSKESSHDYRYFPDPDLPTLRISQIEEFKNFGESLPELPWQKRERLTALGIKAEDVAMLVGDEILGAYFDEVSVALGADGAVLLQLASNYLTSDLAGMRKTDVQIAFPNAARFAELIRMAARGELSSRGAKNLLVKMLAHDADPHALAESAGLLQESDEHALGELADTVIAAHPELVAEFKGGKESVLQRLIGEGIKASGGRANPEVLARLLRERIK